MTPEQRSKLPAYARAELDRLERELLVSGLIVAGVLALVVPPTPTPAQLAFLERAAA